MHLGYWGAFAVTEGGIYLLDADASPGPAILYYDFKTRKTKQVLLLDHMVHPWIQTVTASRDGLTLFLMQQEPQMQILLAERSQ